ncbi:hypothetical protein B2G71_14105 [Novosphingobium sp. PC22D]|uniref:PEP-CTERM sorting domain-containing protein n=1 Tax=Novosphingobium sp. PC22D TaxID=1962403 RepID=UPI000BF18FC3|nr:PEP-CTERM sorting domain-containing protein [Novosphingobium sp. PC22D]PEQ11916.1 hypothetical protein B2G71_14105 [Novosphingobium sp. PC22D]
MKERSLRRAPIWIALVATSAISTPAFAGGSFPLPEPSSLVLFGLGAAGLALGRRLATKKTSDKD